MNPENTQLSNKLKDLQISKIILCKLIKHYSYNSIVDYLFNPNKISNPKLESIMKRLINRMGVDNLAFLLCNEKLNSISINKQKEKEEEKSSIKQNKENEKTKYKTFLIKKSYKNRMLINKGKKYYKNYLLHKYYKKKKSRNIHLNEDDDSSENNNFSSFNNLNEESENSDDDNSNMNSKSNNSSEDDNSNSNNNTYNNYCNDFDEFCDSEINKANIINIVNEMELEEGSNEIKDESFLSKKEKESNEIILNDTNSYVNQIIYKTALGELFYYCFENFNEDKTIKMHCIDEICKSKGIYNPKNKQISIISEHTIEYDDHCYFKINFGGSELDLGIFDFIKDSPEITGIEILKSNDDLNININEENNGEKIDKKDNVKGDNEDNVSIINEKNEENNLNVTDTNTLTKESKNQNISQEIKVSKKPIYQNRICNNITQIILKPKNKEKLNEKKDTKEKENFTLFNLNNNLTSNNIRTTKPNIIKQNKDIKEIDFIQKNDIKNSSTETNKITNEESNNYNFVEFNIDNIKKTEGTENSYSKEVYKINLENKKLVDELNKLNNEKNKRSQSKSKRGMAKLKEKINEQKTENYPKILSRSSSPSYLMNEENIVTYNDNDNDNINDIENINEIENESEFSKLSVISHFENKKYEEKIYIDENDSLFSFDMISQTERENYNKRINDEIISISEDYSEKRRKRLEKIQKKIQESQLRKYLKKKEPQRKSLFRVNERPYRPEEEVNNIPNKRRVFGITRRSMSPVDTKVEKNLEEENKEKIKEEENDKNKKGMPIFGIYNPNKHNPIFFINSNINKK